MKITIIGASKSGYSAAILANKLGYEVFISENQSKDNFLNEIEILDKLSISYEFGGHSENILDCDFAITSPGAPPSSFPIRLLEENKIEIISELEFAYQNLINKENIIAITGTNGKTTTTSLIHYILEKSGKSSLVSGNIGTPLCDLVLDLNNNLNDKINQNTILVIECSSYQLDKIKTFTPKVAMILNLSPDHLAYHSTFQQYLDAKWKISCNMNENNLLILNNDDATLMGKLNSIGEDRNGFNVKTFSLSNTMSDIFLENDIIYIKTSYINSKNQVDNYSIIKEELMNIASINLPGVHNIYNSLAAILAVRAFEVRNEDIRDALHTFQGVEHRLEYVETINNIRFINDSKATNINSTWFALNSYDKPIIWIAGGRAENNPYEELDSTVKKHVKLVICIGEETENIYNHYCTITKVVKASDMNDAITISLKEANKNDVVLFSPACKSFDMFANYEHRGQVFKEVVKNNKSNN